MSFFYLLMKECGLFTQIPSALGTIADNGSRSELTRLFEALLAP
jgi:hypothetical protein